MTNPRCALTVARPKVATSVLRSVAFALLLALVAWPCRAQDKIWTLKGRTVDARFGTSVTRLDDLDGDGVAELAVGAPGTIVSGLIDAGSVFLIDGATLESVRTLSGTAIGDQIGGAMDCGLDFDGDGVRDLLVGSGRSWRDCDGACEAPLLDGRVSLFSGATGDELRTIRPASTKENIGASVALLPDQTGDGVPEIAFGSIGITVASHSEVGRVTVLSGADLALLYSHDGDSTRLRLGSALAALDDADGDGFADLAVGAPGYIVTPGYVVILSGPNGRPTCVLTGTDLDSRFGTSLAAVDDLDGDGRRDLLVGAPKGSARLGQAQVYGSASGYTTVLRTYVGEVLGSEFGFDVASAGDVDGDGVDDHAVGAPGWSLEGIDHGAAHVFRGADGERIFRAVGKSSRDRMGAACVSGWGGPRYSDLLVASPAADPGGQASAGSVTMLRATPRLACLSGTVHQGAGPTFDVLTANELIGDPIDRVIVIERDVPFVVHVDVPPSRTISRFAMYGYAGIPEEWTQQVQPFGVGIACFATPYGGDFELPRAIWNNLGEPLVFGTPTFPSTPAPSDLVVRPSGVGRRLRATLQGIIRDDASAGSNGLSMTNAIVLEVP